MSANCIFSLIFFFPPSSLANVSEICWIDSLSNPEKLDWTLFCVQNVRFIFFLQFFIAFSLPVINISILNFLLGLYFWEMNQWCGSNSEMCFSVFTNWSALQRIDSFRESLYYPHKFSLSFNKSCCIWVPVKCGQLQINLFIYKLMRSRWRGIFSLLLSIILLSCCFLFF